jgi:hypothetical protein
MTDETTVDAASTGARRREYRLSLVLLPTAAVLLVLGASRWTLAGDPVLPSASAVGWLLLAATGALVATGRLGRRLVAVLVGVAATAQGFAVTGASAPLGLWGALMLGACVVAAAVGVLALVRGGSWPRMSDRYGRSAVTDRPVTGRDAAARPREAWAALDRGEDPTLDPDAPQ